NMNLAELSRGMVKFPQTLINVRFKQGDTPLASTVVQASVKEAEAALEERGRVLLRKSGTEPLIRVMVEANDAQDSTKWAEHIADAVRNVTN
ncbi:MAG: phosphoglucosamine mutase, partial [Paraglaciecola sp.]